MTISAAAAGWVIARLPARLRHRRLRGRTAAGRRGIGLPTIYAMAAVAAVAMGLLSIAITRPAAQGSLEKATVA